MWLQFLFRAAGSLAVIIGLQILYRLILHPLAGFPGPKIAAATKWYEFYFDCVKGEGGQYAWEIQKMHQKYGPIVRINPDEIHIMDSGYFGTIYAPFPARRDKWYPAAKMTGSSRGSFGTIDHFAHRKRRAANSILFATKAVTDATPQIQHRVENLCHSLAMYYEKSVPVLIPVETLAFTTDLMTSIVLGRPLGCQDDKAIAKSWFTTSNCLPRITPLVKQFPWIVTVALRLPSWMVSAIYPDIALLVTLRRQMVWEAKQHAQRRSHVESTQKDVHSQRNQNLFEVLDNSDLPPEEKDVHRQAQEAFVLVAGGTETTARTIAGCLFQLVYHSEKFARLRKELETVMPKPDSQPSLKTLENLPYLTAVLKENLRSMQMMTSRFPIQSHTDLQYKQWTIPKMVPVSMTISEVLLDPFIYDEPRSFVPERWLDTDKATIRSFDTNFVAFGRGTRACQGQGIAWAMMYICVAQIVRRFDLELFDTTYERDFEVRRDCFLGIPMAKSKGIRFMIKRDLAKGLATTH